MKTRYIKVICLLLFISLLVGLYPLIATAAEKVILRASAGPTGTGKDLRIQMVAEAIRRGNPKWVVDTINGPTTIAEITMIGRGELDFTALDAVSIPDIAKGYYGGKKLPKPVNLRWLIPSTAMTCVLYMLENVPINSFAEIKEKKYPAKFSMGRKGTDPYNILMHVFQAYGYSPDDIVKWGGKRQNTASRRSADLMADGLMDVFFHAGTYPAPPIAEMERTRKLKAAFVFEPEIQAKLSKKLFIEVPIKAGSYTFVKNNTTTVAMPSIVVVPDDMKDDVAYNMTRAVWEQREKFLHPLHPIFRAYVQPEVITAWTTKLRNFLHPAAARYWKEQGLLK